MFGQGETDPYYNRYAKDKVDSKKYENPLSKSAQLMIKKTPGRGQNYITGILPSKILNGSIENNSLQKDMQKVFNPNNLINIDNNKNLHNNFNLRYLNKPANPNPISTVNYNFSSSQKNITASNNQNSQVIQISNNGNTLQISIDDILEKIRQKLTQRGITGILSIAKSFRINDIDNSRTINFNEFSNLCYKYGLGLSDIEIKSAFALFDKKRNGNIDYDEFLSIIRGSLNQFRRNLVEQAFNIMDRNKNGYIDYNDIVGVFDASKHPQVVKGERSAESVYSEFLAGFQMNHSNSAMNRGNFMITKQEWIEYYENVSMSIDNDSYFELMMNNCWRMNNCTNYNNNVKGWSNKSEDPLIAYNFEENFQRRNYNNNNNNNNNNNSIINNNINVNNGIKQNNSINVNNINDLNMNNNMKSNETQQKNFNKSQLILEKFKNKLFLRGSNTIFSLARQFKIIDDNNSKTLSYEEFVKVNKDFKTDLTQSEIITLYSVFDRNKNNSLDYDEFLRAVRGEMNERRKAIVREAFNILDVDKSGVIEINDLKNMYNMRKNLDVLSGRKSEEEAYGEFLQTMEYHFNIYKKKSDRKITLEEFYEYYNNISCSIDNDDYFELMMKNAWNLDNRKYAAGGSADFTNQVNTKNNFINNSNIRNNQIGSNFVNQPNIEAPQNIIILKNNNENYNNPEPNQCINPNFPLNQTNFGNKNINIYINPKSDPLMLRLREKILSRGIKGILGIRRSFKIVDSHKTNKINEEDLGRLFKNYRFDVSDVEFRKIFEVFDSDKSGIIDFDEFLYGMIGEMNEFRKNLVKRAFALLDKTGNGQVELDEIRQRYNAKQHPEVLRGKKTEDQVLASFLDTFETHFSLLNNKSTMNQRVDLNEFFEYYNHVSASIDDDIYFEQMMNSSWNLDNSNKNYGKSWKG